MKRLQPKPRGSLTCLIVMLVSCLATPLAAQDAPRPVAREVIYGHKDGLALTFDVFQPTGEPNGAAVLFMVSGGWYSKWSPPESMRGLFGPFLDAGYTVFAIRHGSSPRYSIAEAVADVRRAVRTIRRDAEQYKIDPDRLGVMGMSAGGHLTLMLATTGDDGNPDSGDSLARTSSRIAAGVAFVPPTDLAGVVWEAPGSDPQYRNFPALNISVEEAKKVSPLNFVTPDDAPSLVMMGGADKLVPPEHGEWIHKKMDEIGVENKLIVYKGSGHGLEGNLPNAFQEALAWFNEHLKK